MTAKELLSKAASNICNKHPFWATFLFSVSREEDPSIKTTSTNGEVIRYNPQYIESLNSILEVETVLAHLVGHIFLGHHLRRGTRDIQKWQIASDYVVNLILISAGFEPLQKWHYDTGYINHSTEQVYALLSNLSTNSTDQSNETDPLDCGDVEDLKDPKDTPLSNSKLREKENELKSRIRLATAIAKKAGDLSSDLERKVEEILEPKIDWQEVLSRFINEKTNDDYSWQQPNRRYLQYDLYLPSLHRYTFGKIIFALDSSASVTEEELKQMVSEIFYCMSLYDNNTELPVIYCDSKIKGVEIMRSGETPKPKGGGGTRFSPVMNYIKKDEQGFNPTALIYQTDGHCSDFGEDPGIPVLWVISGENPNITFSPPFGEALFQSN